MEMDPGVMMGLLNQKDGNTGGEFIWVLLMFMLFGGGMMNRNGNGDNSDIETAVKAANSDAIQTNNLLNAIQGNSTAISNLAQFLNVETNALACGIGKISDSVNQVAYQGNMNTRDVLQGISTGNSVLQAQMAECCCNTQRAVDGVNYNMSLMGKDIALQNQVNTQSLSKQMSDSLYTVGLDNQGMRHLILTGHSDLANQISTQNCELKNDLTTQLTLMSFNQEKGFQSILNALTQQDIDRLRSELATAKGEISQLAQTNALEAFIRDQMSACCPTSFASPYQLAQSGVTTSFPVLK